jgi:hypothetical protein
VRVVAAVALCLALALGSTAAPLASAADRVYKWVDENGIAHYTTDPDSIPSHLRRGRDLGEPREPDLSAIPAPRTDPTPAPAPEVLSSRPPLLEPSPEAGDELQAIPPPRALPGPRKKFDGPAAGGTAAVAPAPRASESTGPQQTVEPTSGLRTDAPEPTPIQTSTPPTVDTAPPDRQLEQVPSAAAEIRELEAQIARDRDLMKSLISGTGTQGAELAADPRFREIAERLPRLQSELDALREETAPRTPDRDRASGTGR